MWKNSSPEASPHFRYKSPVTTWPTSAVGFRISGRCSASCFSFLNSTMASQRFFLLFLTALCISTCRSDETQVLKTDNDNSTVAGIDLESTNKLDLLAETILSLNRMSGFGRRLANSTRKSHLSRFLPEAKSFKSRRDSFFELIDFRPLNVSTLTSKAGEFEMNLLKATLLGAAKQSGDQEAEETREKRDVLSNLTSEASTLLRHLVEMSHDAAANATAWFHSVHRKLENATDMLRSLGETNLTGKLSETSTPPTPTEQIATNLTIEADATDVETLKRPSRQTSRTLLGRTWFNPLGFLNLFRSQSTTTTTTTTTTTQPSVSRPIYGPYAAPTVAPAPLYAPDADVQYGYGPYLSPPTASYGPSSYDVPGGYEYQIPDSSDSPAYGTFDSSDNSPYGPASYEFPTPSPDYGVPEDVPGAYGPSYYTEHVDSAYGPAYEVEIASSKPPQSKPYRFRHRRPHRRPHNG